jgi:hypothetical protein
MDVAAVMHHILLICCIAYLTQIHLILDSVVDPADPVTNWPPGSGSIILNYRSDSGSLLFIEGLKKFQKISIFYNIL